MKTIADIERMLAEEIHLNINQIDVENSDAYYNDKLGDCSFLLAGLLDRLLAATFKEWDNKKWMDDSLITEVRIVDNKISMFGVMIWGIRDTTAQWTEPFYFEMYLRQDLFFFDQYTFLFADLNRPEITYEQFRDNRGYWNEGYHHYDYGDLSTREWKYIIPVER